MAGKKNVCDYNCFNCKLPDCVNDCGLTKLEKYEAKVREALLKSDNTTELQLYLRMLGGDKTSYKDMRRYRFSSDAEFREREKAKRKTYYLKNREKCLAKAAEWRRRKKNGGKKE